MTQSFGAGYYPPQQPPRPLEQHPRAVPSLVLGILSLVLCGLFTGIPAIIMGRRAAADIRYAPGRFTGLGLARAGFWTGLVGTIWSIVSTVLVIAVFVVGGITSSSFEGSCTSVDQNGRTSTC